AELVERNRRAARDLRARVRGGELALMALRVMEAENRVAHFEAGSEAHKFFPVRDAPEFAVGDDRQAAALLQADHVADAFVLHRTQFGLGNLSQRALAERLAQPLRTQQAADMVSAKGRDHELSSTRKSI